MNPSYDFDADIPRDGSASLKYDARQALFGRADVLPLWVADMDFAAPPAVTQALIARAQHPIYGYTQYPESMYDALIHWLQRRHGWQVAREWIVMCPGVVPSLYASIQALTQPNDAVIVQPPVYFPFFSAVHDTGRSLLENPLKLTGHDYTIDFAHFEACAAQASMLLFCSPHNPVGRVWTKSELNTLIHIARANNLTILSDEVHADLIYPNHQHHVLASLADDLTVITAVAPSKTFNVAGLNLSALIIPNAEQRAAVSQVFSHFHLSATNPFSITAFEAAYQNGEDWLAALLLYLNHTRAFVMAFVAEHLPKLQIIPAEGTYLLWLDCRGLHMNDAELKHFFVHQAGVGLSQGLQFGAPGSGFMRMNIGAPRRTIQLALTRIQQALNQL